MELRHLNHLIVAIEMGTISKAAQSLGISQPALTKSIRSLENLLQVKLLDRRSRGVVPTVYGDIVLAHGRSVRVELRELLNQVQALRSGRGGSVRIGITQGVGSRLVPAATIRLATQQPNNRFSVWTGTTSELVALLKNGDIEFAVAPLERHHDAMITDEFLFDDRPVMVAAPTHPLSGQSMVQPRELVKCRWALAGPATALRRMLDQIFMSDNIPPPIPVVECDSGLYVKPVLMDGGFVGFMPRDEINAEEKAGLLKGIPFKTDVSPRPIGILRRRGEVLSPQSMVFIKAIRQVCKEFGYVA